MFDVDVSELRSLATDLGNIPTRLLPEADAIVKRGAQNVKEHMSADLAASRSFRGAAGSVSYDSDYRPGVVQYEVGPDKGRRGGALANIAYFGGANGGGGTVDIDAPLAAEEPRLSSAIGEVLDGLL
ncbi:hypothetical protein ACFWFR_00870 [Oerskovia sp. NPDC060287]|uniref:hypothetical protein n=1 Tax=Oerskovia sp. NPDC060287 TaxID=3347095 RepID=UPI003665B642